MLYVINIHAICICGFWKFSNHFNLLRKNASKSLAISQSCTTYIQSYTTTTSPKSPPLSFAHFGSSFGSFRAVSELVGEETTFQFLSWIGAGELMKTVCGEPERNSDGERALLSRDKRAKTERWKLLLDSSSWRGKLKSDFCNFLSFFGGLWASFDSQASLILCTPAMLFPGCQITGIRWGIANGTSFS